MYMYIIYVVYIFSKNTLRLLETTEHFNEIPFFVIGDTTSKLDGLLIIINLSLNSTPIKAKHSIDERYGLVQESSSHPTKSTAL